jgi:hypothetical protein
VQQVPGLRLRPLGGWAPAALLMLLIAIIWSRLDQAPSRRISFLLDGRSSVE